MEGICRLCRRHADLQESHIIPAFVFRWRKDTAPTPFMRASDEPNRRVQDGLTQYWLCRDCEQKLGFWERKFSNTIFRSVTENGTCRVQYGEWLLKFCVSISWRILLLAQEKDSLLNLSAEHQAAALNALYVWEIFLRGQAPHPGKFEQHLLVLDGVDSIRGVALPPNINRYSMRSIDIDIGSTDEVGFTFAKMGPVAVLGFYFLDRPRAWSGGKVHVKHGIIGPTTYILPPVFVDYLLGRARKYGEIHDALSDRQRQVANMATTEGLMNKKDKVLASHWLKAMRRDIDMFGDRALDIGFPDKGVE